MNRNCTVLLCAATALVLTALACGPTSTITPTVPPPAPTESGQVAGPSPTATAPQPTETPAGCALSAHFVADMTIPDDTPFLPNTPFVKTWRLQNSGTCDWEAGTRLAYVSGDPLGGPTTVDVQPLAPGQYVDVSVNLIAPATPGTYRSNWRMQSPEGTLFGDSVYVQIVVPAPTTTPLPPTDTPIPPTHTPVPTAEWPIVRQGDQGAAVVALQYLLRAEGYTLTADGIFGAQTNNAVRSFQTAKGLTADGVVGPNTWSALTQGHMVQTGSSDIEAVQAVQYLLVNKHGYTLTVDGIFGTQTRQAVRDFQAAHGLTADGIVGPNTWKALVAD